MKVLRGAVKPVKGDNNGRMMIGKDDAVSSLKNIYYTERGTFRF